MRRRKIDRLTDADKLTISQKAILIDSDLFANLTYGIHPENKGISVMYNKNEIPIAAVNFEEFIEELRSIWNQYK